jgi:hypothetical protein
MCASGTFALPKIPTEALDPVFPPFAALVLISESNKAKPRTDALLGFKFDAGCNCAA